MTQEQKDRKNALRRENRKKDPNKARARYEKEYAQAKQRKEKESDEQKAFRLARRNAYLAQWREENRQHINDHHKEWRISNPDKIKTAAHKSYVKDKDKKAAYTKEWRKRNPDKVREINRRTKQSERYRVWLEQNRGVINAKNKEYRSKNREKINDRVLQWERTSPVHKAWYEKYAPIRNRQMMERYHRHREHYVEYQNEWGYAPRRAAIFIKWEKCGELCYICGQRVEKEKVNIDHVHPRSKGGSNDISNLMPVHKTCNIKKKDKLNYPIARPDLVILVADVKAFPRTPKRKAA